MGTADALPPAELQVAHVRTEAGLRLSVGRNIGPRQAVLFGPSLALAWTRAGFDYTERLNDVSVGAFYPSPRRFELQTSLGGEGRWSLGRRFALVITLESLFVPRAAEHRCAVCEMDVGLDGAPWLSTSVRSRPVSWRVGVGLAWQHGPP